MIKKVDKTSRTFYTPLFTCKHINNNKQINFSLVTKLNKYHQTLLT